MKKNVEEIRQQKEQKIQKAYKCLKKDKGCQIGLVLGNVLGGALIVAGAITIIITKVFTPLVYGFLFSGLITQSLGTFAGVAGDKFYKKAKALTLEAQKLDEKENALSLEENCTNLKPETKEITKVKLNEVKTEKENNFELLN